MKRLKFRVLLQALHATICVLMMTACTNTNTSAFGRDSNPGLLYSASGRVRWLENMVLTLHRKCIMSRDGSVDIVPLHHAHYPCRNFVRIKLTACVSQYALLWLNEKHFLFSYLNNVNWIRDPRQGRGRGGGGVSSLSFRRQETRIPTAVTSLTS